MIVIDGIRLKPDWQTADLAAAIERRLRAFFESRRDDGGDAAGTPAWNRTASVQRPVVVGAGPCGLFAALTLAEAGLRPILLEQGEPVERRAGSVRRYWRAGAAALNPHSNVQFGEGGAGTFSDGKLNTGTRSPWHRMVLETFVQYGAPPEILYDAQPHIGTDRLSRVIPAMRRGLIEKGGEVRFDTEVTGLIIEGGAAAGLELKQVQTGARSRLSASRIILAPGHSSRRLTEVLYRQGVAISAKPFAVGVRIEHPQTWVNQVSYGAFAAAAYPELPAAPYKMAVHPACGRSVYTFCMCPGGFVVASASGPDQVVTNGMSRWQRRAARSNSALLVNVLPEDTGADLDPMAGFRFQDLLERRAFQAGGSDGFAPAQTVGDFLNRRISIPSDLKMASYRPGVRPADLRDVLPDFVSAALAEALPLFDRKMEGFCSASAVMTGVESRSSSPVRILRDPQTGESGVRGLYPAGEGAGYAGGILSAAADGIRTAGQVLNAL